MKWDSSHGPVTILWTAGDKRIDDHEIKADELLRALSVSIRRGSGTTRAMNVRQDIVKLFYQNLKRDESGNYYIEARNDWRPSKWRTRPMS